MAPNLDSCPDEIMANITQLLDVYEICCLRSSSRSLATKCTNAHFKSLFLSRRVDLTETALKRFAKITQPGLLGCLIQDLTLVGISKGPKGSTFKEVDFPTEYKIKLLVQAFSGLCKKTSGIGKLPSLTLEVAITSETGERSLPSSEQVAWKRVWQAARDVFSITWHALAASKLPVEKLNVFNSRQMQQCSLPSNCLGEVNWETPELAAVFKSLRSLSVSLCPRDLDAFELKGDGEGLYDNNWDDNESRKLRDKVNIQADADEEVNFSGLANLLRLCNHLDYFEIHYFDKSAYGCRGIDRKYERLIQRVVELDRLPTISHCRLRGVFVSGQDLLALIQGTRVSDFAMIMVHSDTFRPIFDYCQGNATTVTKVFFDDLWEERKLIYFDTPGEQKFPRSVHVDGCTTLQRKGDEVKLPILYFDPGGRPFGSPPTVLWMQERRKEYGR